MGKVFGILLIVVGVWVGMEVYTQGVRGAFGGAFAFLAAEPPPPPGEEHRWVGERARDSVTRARDEAEQRRNRLLGE